jgi:hypothetical protein
MAISCRSSSSGNTTFSQQGRSCFLKNGYQLSQLLLREHHFLTVGSQLLPYQELPTAVTPQRTPLSYSRPQLLPETELLSTVPVLPQRTPLSYSRSAVPYARIAISCRSSSSRNTIFSQQGHSCSLNKIAINCAAPHHGSEIFFSHSRAAAAPYARIAISCRITSSGNTTFSQQGRGCSQRQIAISWGRLS